MQEALNCVAALTLCRMDVYRSYQGATFEHAGQPYICQSLANAKRSSVDDFDCVDIDYCCLAAIRVLNGSMPAVDGMLHLRAQFSILRL